MNLIPEMLRVAILGGVLAVDRAAGWSTMLSQPLVGACLAGALVNPGPEWELWALASVASSHSSAWRWRPLSACAHRPWPPQR